MRKFAVVILAVVLCLSLVGCAQTENIDFPFERSDVENVEMFHFVDPTDAEKKVIVKPEDIEDIYALLESIPLEDKETEPVAGSATTAFRFNLSDGTTYEVLYSSIAVKSGRIMLTETEKDYFTSADIEANWTKYDYETEKVAENELPTF